MRLDQSAFAFRSNVTVMTPQEWVMPPDAKGPFRFRFEIRPPTEEFGNYIRRQMAKRETSEAVAALQVGGKTGMKHTTKYNQRLFSRSPQETRSKEQQAHDKIRSELVENAWQIFEDGTEAVCSAEDLEVAFTIPAEDAERWAHVENAAADYIVEDFPNEDNAEALLRRLDIHGESLAHALARFVQHHSVKADAQKAERVEKEISSPLGSTPGSTPGNKLAAGTTISGGVVGDSTSSDAESAGESGSRADAAPVASGQTG